MQNDNRDNSAGFNSYDEGDYNSPFGESIGDDVYSFFNDDAPEPDPDNTPGHNDNINGILIKILIAAAAVAVILAVCIVLVVFKRPSTSGYSQAETSSNNNNQTENQKTGTQRTDSDSYGYDFSDFYSNQYITSYENPDDSRYREVCAVENNWYLGTASSPAPSEKEFKIWYKETSFLAYTKLSYSDIRTGYMVCYSQPESDEDMSIDELTPPKTSDKNTFFEKTRDKYLHIPQRYIDNYFNVQIGDVQEIEINGSTVCYMETQFTDSADNQLIDIITFEEKPQKYAFITRYRFKKDEYADGPEAIRELYSHLNFYTKDFKNVDASSRTFHKGKVYRTDNSQSAEIDISEIDPDYSKVNGKGSVSFICGDYYEPDMKIGFGYNNLTIYNSEDFDDYVDFCLEGVEDGSAIRDLELLEKKIFSFYGMQTYYYSVNYVQSFGGNLKNVRSMHYKIVNAEAESLNLNITVYGKIPEDFDAETFLNQHVTIE